MTNRELIHDSFNVPSLAGMGGLGQLSIPSDVTQWGAGQWAAVLIGGYLAVRLFGDLKTVGSHVGKKAKQTRSKIKKTAVSGTSKIGTVVTVGALAAAGVMAYEVYSSQSGGTQ